MRYLMRALCALLILVSASSAVFAADTLTTAGQLVINRPGDSGVVLGVGQVSASFVAVGLSETTAATTANSATDSADFKVEAIFSDTIQLLGTTDTRGLVSTVGNTIATFTVVISNLGNTSDSIRVTIGGETANIGTPNFRYGTNVATDTTGGYTFEFISADTSGNFLGRPFQGKQGGTATLMLAPGASDTLKIQVYAANGDTNRLIFAVQTFVGDSPTRFAVKTYQGYNGDSYAGDGHDSISLYVDVVSTLIHIAKADTVFSPVALSSNVQDTQHYVPGANVVYTIWLDQDASAAVDTIVLEDWIDTRYVRFDTDGIRHGGMQYGAILNDSAFPATEIAGSNLRVAIQVDTGSGFFALTEATLNNAANTASRIRWTISRNGGVIFGNNGDSAGDADSVGVQSPGAPADTDLAYVRFAVTIR